MLPEMLLSVLVVKLMKRLITRINHIPTLEPNYYNIKYWLLYRRIYILYKNCTAIHGSSLRI